MNQRNVYSVDKEVEPSVQKSNVELFSLESLEKKEKLPASQLKILEDAKNPKAQTPSAFPLIQLTQLTLKNPLKEEKIKYPRSFLLNYFSTEDLLNYRLVCRDTLKATKEMTGPYYSFKDFIIATSGTFYDAKSDKKNSDSDSYFKKCTSAWFVYSQTIDHEADKGSSVLYKFRNMKIKIDDVLDWSARMSGRVYQPQPTCHHMTVNMAWLLAQFHSERPFTVLSDITEKNLQREESPSQFSAFSKELAALFKVGYTMGGLSSQNCIMFLPSHSNKQLTIRDIKANELEIKTAFGLFSQQQKILTKVKETIDSIKNIVNEIDHPRFPQDDKKMLKQKLQTDINQLLKTTLECKEYSIFACQQFIILFNSTPLFGFKMETLNGEMDKTQLILRIQQEASNFIEKRVEKLIYDQSEVTKPETKQIEEKKIEKLNVDQPTVTKSTTGRLVMSRVRGGGGAASRISKFKPIQINAPLSPVLTVTPSSAASSTVTPSSAASSPDRDRLTPPTSGATISVPSSADDAPTMTPTSKQPTISPGISEAPSSPSNDAILSEEPGQENDPGVVRRRNFVGLS